MKMKCKKIFLTLFLIFFMLSIFSVSASDLNDTITSADDNNMLEITEENDMTESSQEDILSASDDGTFTALQQKIYDANTNSTITLDRDYTYDEGFSTRGIVIDKDLTINGNGHTINGLSESRIFLVKLGKLAPYKVTLNNIKFINGNTNLYGGAVFNYADLTVNNCQFNNNHAKYSGGAICSIGYLECKNSKFDKNIADGDGGAIFTLSLRGTLDNMIWTLINASREGSLDFLTDFVNDNTLVYTQETISNCVFTNNVAKGRGGGAIYGFGHINIKKSTFTSNKAGEKGGAVFGNKNLFISDSKFTSNQAPQYGGAVYFRCHDQGGHYENKKWISKINYYSNSIKNSVFTKNTASKGGAIYAFRYSDSDTVHCAKAVKCTFEANKASKGRDIYGGTTSKCVFNYLKLTLKKVKIKKSAKKLVLTAKLKKGLKPIKHKKITFKFKGKTYKAKTNKKGIAKIKIKKKVLKKLKVGKKVKYQAKYSKLVVKRTAKVKK